MKGVELPFSTTVVLIIAIIVIILIIAFFIIIYPSTGVSMKCQAEFRTECVRFKIEGNCNFADYLRINELKTNASCAIGTDNEDEITKACCS